MVVAKFHSAIVIRFRALRSRLGNPSEAPPTIAGGPPALAPIDLQHQASPQGPTGPIETKSGGTRAASPQGDTPAGMQAMPQGVGEGDFAGQIAGLKARVSWAEFVSRAVTARCVRFERLLRQSGQA